MLSDRDLFKSLVNCGYKLIIDTDSFFSEHWNVRGAGEISAYRSEYYVCASCGAEDDRTISGVVHAEDCSAVQFYKLIREGMTLVGISAD